MNIEDIYTSYGLRSEKEIYQYLVESYFNGQLNQAKKIFLEIRSLNSVNDYVKQFTENLEQWFEPDTCDIIKTFFKIKK